MNALLKKARLEKGYTTRALSAVTHIDNALLCKYENGKRNPTKEQLKILASTLDLNYNELLLLWTKNKIIEQFGLDSITLKAMQEILKEHSQEDTKIDSILLEIETLKNKLQQLK